MALIVRKISLLLVIFTGVLCLSGCDNLSTFLHTFSSPQQSSEQEGSLEMVSYEKELLLEILDNQKMLIEEMQYASESGEKQSIKEAYEKFMQLDQQYQDEFEKLEDGLSNRDALEISKRHHQVVKSLPSYSNLMK